MQAWVQHRLHTRAAAQAGRHAPFRKPWKVGMARTPHAAATSCSWSTSTFKKVTLGYCKYSKQQPACVSDRAHPHSWRACMHSCSNPRGLGVRHTLVLRASNTGPITWHGPHQVACRAQDGRNQGVERVDANEVVKHQCPVKGVVHAVCLRGERCKECACHSRAHASTCVMRAVHQHMHGWGMNQCCASC